MISVNFSFVGLVSKDTSRRKDIHGLNGALVVQDVFSKVICANTQLNRADPYDDIQTKGRWFANADARFYNIIYEDNDSKEMTHNKLKLYLKSMLLS